MTMAQRRDHREVLRNKENENTTYPKLCNTVKAAFEGKCTAVEAYIKKKKYLKSVKALYLKD